MTEIKSYFVFDRLIDESDFCNFTKERKRLEEHIGRGDCVKLYGPRNFGKTSLLKNIIAKQWEATAPAQRIAIYADLFSVQTLEDIDLEIHRAFSFALNTKRSHLSKGFDWLKMLKNIRPTWTISGDPSSFGEFSFTFEQKQGAPDLGAIIESINILNAKNELKFLIILDEFQEIAKIKKAEAHVRGALQNLSSKIPVVILGSKQHLLTKIFEKPRAPFNSWGFTVEFKPIPTLEYAQYINQRTSESGFSLSLEVSEFLQSRLNRIPEAINRFCAFMCTQKLGPIITIEQIDNLLAEFVDLSRSTYEFQFAHFSVSSQRFIVALAKSGPSTHLTGMEFLRKIPSISKSNLSNILSHLLDDSVVSQGFDTHGTKIYWVTDPFFAFFARKYK